MIKYACSLTLILLLALPALAQDAPQVRMSPVTIASTTVNGTYIKVVYGQPQKRDRVVFGELVPYGQVWRTGANEATEITFTDDVEIAGETVPAGVYSVFSIPGEEEWTIILNSSLGQWGTRYNQDNNVFSAAFPSEKMDVSWEAFTIRFESEENVARLNMMWDDTKVVVPITVK
ncbi:MAG: DUF2911 domain-containing protein [Cyclonatronaceae bacterium]